MEFIEKVKLFNEIAGTKNEFDKRKAALYVGLICEELGELFDSFKSDNFNSNTMAMNSLSMLFKQGSYDYLFDTVDRVEFIDAVSDITVVALGAGIAIGADISGACNAVADNNLEKFPIHNGIHTVLRDANGKIAKPPNFKSVELSEFVK